jgi:hypothetical protein
MPQVAGETKKEKWDSTWGRLERQEKWETGAGHHREQDW